jgi:predicted transcriptional regulator
MIVCDIRIVLIEMSEEEYIHLPPEETVIQYLNRELKKHHVPQSEVARALDMDQSNVSRLLRKTKGAYRRLGYEEAYQIILLILKHVSSVSNESIVKYYTRSEDLVFVHSDEPVINAVKKMMDGKFTQIPVLEEMVHQGNMIHRCIGILTDWALLRRMLHPIRSVESWLKEFIDMTIRDADVIDEVPRYPLESPLLEVSEGLMHHYAVLIEEGAGKYGIITRADFLKLLLSEGD